MRISDWSSDVCSSDLNVRVGGDLRTGAGSMTGEEAVIGTVQMLIGQNSRVVATEASSKLDQAAKTLPPGIPPNVVVNRAESVCATLEAVQRNLTDGALLLVVAVFLLL